MASAIECGVCGYRLQELNDPCPLCLPSFPFTGITPVSRTTFTCIICGAVVDSERGPCPYCVPPTQVVRGCICPPTSEQTCQSPTCPRKT
jgi:hypothetical protein